MTRSILRLAADDMWSVLDAIDPVAALAEELIGRAIGHPDADRRPAGRLAAWTGPEGDDLVLLEHPQTSTACLLPATSLRMFQAAALAALAARELLVPGGVTLAMLGATQTTQPQLSLIAGQVPDISHVAICLADRRRPVPLEARLVDQLELSGIGLSVVTTQADAVFGANLVIATGEGAMRQNLDPLRLGQLVRGTVLINATGRDLPDDLVERVDQVYVDDLAELAAHADRFVVARHLAAAGSGAGTEDAPAPRRPTIAGDLGRLLAGTHPGRERADDIVLVELLGPSTLNVALAHKIFQAARQHGLGTQVTQ